MAYLLQILVVVISLRIKLGANKQITQLALYTMIGPKQKMHFIAISLNVFSTKALIRDSILTSPTGDRTTTSHRHLTNTKVQPATCNERKYIDFSLTLKCLDTVFLDQYLPSLSINYVAINKHFEKLPPRLH